MDPRSFSGVATLDAAGGTAPLSFPLDLTEPITLALARPDEFAYDASWRAVRVVMLARGEGGEGALADGDAVMAAVLRHAGANGRDVVGLRLSRSAVAWALSTCFAREWYAVGRDSRGAFERTREYALGELDLAAAEAEAEAAAGARETTGIVFVRGRALLERLHFDALTRTRNDAFVLASGAGREWGEWPLVVGKEYAYVIASRWQSEESGESEGPEYPEMACVVLVLLS
jgi:hypothetical protein